MNHCFLLEAKLDTIHYCQQEIELFLIDFFYFKGKGFRKFEQELNERKNITILTNLNNPANIYLFKVNNKNTSEKSEICSKLTLKTLEQRHWLRSVVFIVNFKHISHLSLVFLLLTLNQQTLSGHQIGAYVKILKI